MNLPELSKPGQRIVDQLKRSTEYLRDLCDEIDLFIPPAMTRNDGPSTGPDGYSSNSRPETGRSSDETSSTERAAISRREKDPVMAVCKLGLKELTEAVTKLQTAASQFRYAASIGSDNVGRVNSIAYCENCGEPALPIRSGRCDACFIYRRTHSTSTETIERPTKKNGRIQMQDVANGSDA